MNENTLLNFLKKLFGGGARPTPAPTLASTPKSSDGCAVAESSKLDHEVSNAMVFSTPSGARQTAERILMLSADSVLCRNYLDGQAAIEVVRELGKMGNPNALRLLGEIEAT